MKLEIRPQVFSEPLPANYIFGNLSPPLIQAPPPFIRYLASLDPSGEVHWFGHPGSSLEPDESLGQPARIINRIPGLGT